MKEWKEYKLGDLYDVHNGLSKGGKFFGTGYPFLSFKTVFNNYFLPPVLPDLVQSDEKEQSGYDIKCGDVFITRTSETPEELGMSSVALKDYPFATYNGFTKRLRPKDTSVIYPEFIGYYLRSSKFRALFYGLASSMSTRASLANGDLLGMRVFLPSFETQERIAMILKSLDNKIEVNRQINDNFVVEPLFEILLIWMLTTPINDNLEQQAQALFKSWFVDFEPFKSGEFDESDLGLIPKGWRIEKLGNICSCLLGGTPSRNKEEYWNGDIAWINSGEVNEFRITKPSEYITKEGLANSATKLLPKKSTVLAITGATLGQVSLLEIDSCANQSVIGVLENEDIPYVFIYPLINDRITELCSHMTGGAQQHINKNNVEQLDVIVPTNQILAEYKQKVEPIYSLISNNCIETMELAQLRDSLLSRLMTGELKLDEKTK